MIHAEGKEREFEPRRQQAHQEGERGGIRAAGEREQQARAGRKGELATAEALNAEAEARVRRVAFYTLFLLSFFSHRKYR